MAKGFLVVAPSGAGKTTAGRNLDPKKGIWIVPEDKELPFKGFNKNFHTDYKKDGKSISLKSNYIPEERMGKIQELLVDIIKLPPEKLKERGLEYVIIDTITYAMLRSVRDKEDDPNFAKFIKFANELKDLVDTCKRLPDSIKYIITAHEDVEEASSTIAVPQHTFKVPAGRFTKEKLVPEGLFTIVFWGNVIESPEGNEYRFRTQLGAGTQAKSPFGMFDEMFIPNDYAEIFAKIDEFYGSD